MPVSKYAQFTAPIHPRVLPIDDIFTATIDVRIGHSVAIIS